MVVKTFNIPENKQEALTFINNIDLRNLIDKSPVEFTEWSCDGTNVYISFTTYEYGIMYNTNDNSLMVMDEDNTYDVDESVIESIKMYDNLETLIKCGINKMKGKY